MAEREDPKVYEEQQDEEVVQSAEEEDEYLDLILSDEDPIEEPTYEEVEPEPDIEGEDEDDGSVNTYFNMDDEEVDETSRQDAKYEDSKDPGFIDTTMAAVRQYNTVASVGRYTWDKAADIFTAKEIDLPGMIDQEIQKGNISEENVEAFVNCKTERDFRRVRREILDKKKLEKAGFWQGLIPTLIAGASDPLYYIPMTGALKAASVSKAVIGSTLMAGTSAGLRYSTQETMTPLDIAYETVGAGLLTGVLGGASKLVQSVDFNGWTKSLGKALQHGSDDKIEIKGSEAFINKVSETGNKTAEKVTGFAEEAVFNSPYLKGVKNEDETMRDLTTSLLRGSSVITQETRAGQTQILSAESMVSYKLNEWAGVKDSYSKHFGDFVQSDFGKQVGAEPDYFNLAVTRYLRDTVVRVEDGKISTIYRGTSEIASEVKAAGDELAEFWRKILDDAKEHRVFAAEPPPRESVVTVGEDGKITVIYKDELETKQVKDWENIRKIREEQKKPGRKQASPPGAEKILERDTDKPINIWKRLQKNTSTPQEGSLMEGKVAETLRKLTAKDVIEEGILTEKPVLTRKEYEMPLDEFILKARDGDLSESRITSVGHFTRDYDIEAIYKNEDQFRDMIKRSILKNNPEYPNNKLDILTEETISHVKRLDKEAREPFKGKIAGSFTHSRTVAITDELLEDFLVNNPLQVGDSMVRRLSAATELNRVAREKGYSDWGDLLEKYSAERREKKAGLNLVGEASEKYDIATKENVQMLGDIGEILTGNYGTWDNPKLARVASSIKTLNAMSQLGMVVLSSIPDIAGVVAKHGLKDTIGGIIDSFKKTGIASQQGFSRFVHANDSALMDSKMFTDTYKGKTPPFAKLSRKFFKASLLPAWDSYWKKIAGTLHYGDILDACVRKGTPESDLFLRQNRITKGMRDKISKIYETFGYEEGGNKFLPLGKIKDEEVKRALFSAIHTAANETIITPGAGDIPRVLRKNWGSLLFQYKSFAFAYINNIVTPMFMQKESRKHVGAYVATALTLGGLSTYLKGLATGRETDIEKKDFWVNTVKNAGFLGFFFDTADSIVSFASDPERAFSRLSPLFDFFARTTRAGVATVTAPFKKGEMSNMDRHAIKRSIPFNNLFYYNRAIEEMITSEKTKRRRKRRNK